TELTHCFECGAPARRDKSLRDEADARVVGESTVARIVELHGVVAQELHRELGRAPEQGRRALAVARLADLEHARLLLAEGDRHRVDLDQAIALGAIHDPNELSPGVPLELHRVRDEGRTRL